MDHILAAIGEKSFGRGCLDIPQLLKHIIEVVGQLALHQRSNVLEHFLCLSHRQRHVKVETFLRLVVRGQIFKPNEVDLGNLAVFVEVVPVDLDINTSH